MPLYFFQLRDSSSETLDPDGVELSGLDAARRYALAAARDILASDMLNGCLDLRYRIDIEDSSGAVQYSLPFSDAFTVTDRTE